MSVDAQKADFSLPVASISSGIEEIRLSPPKQKKSKDDLVTQGFAKILDTSKKKLSSLDTQRIVAVIDDAIKRSEIVTLLPYILENIDRYSVVLGSSIVEVLKEYDFLQNEYTKALAKVRRTRPSSSRSSSRSKQSIDASEINDDDIERMCIAEENVKSISSRLVINIKTLLRLFRSNPTALNGIRSERSERSFEANNLIDYIYFIREQLFARLVTSPYEERDKQKTLIQILTREKKARAHISKLEEELNIATAEKDEEIAARNEVLRNNKLSIQSVEQESEVLNRQLLADAGKKETLEVKNSEGRSGKLQQDLIKFKQQLQSNLGEHRESELALRKKKFKIETEVENWIQKYDSEMTEKQDELDELSAHYLEERAQLDALEIRFAKLESEFLAIMEERRIAREKRERDELEMRALIRAATVLQSFWRSYKCRKMLKSKQKKEKKKGKKKKK